MTVMKSVEIRKSPMMQEDVNDKDLLPCPPCTPQPESLKYGKVLSSVALLAIGYRSTKLFLGAHET